jgi:3-phytase
MACKKTYLIFLLLPFVTHCGKIHDNLVQEGTHPIFATESVSGVADEVGVWVDRHEPIRSVIIGNDKSHTGALYVYDLRGKFIHRSPYMNNPVGVSIRYDIPLNGEHVDVVGCGLRSSNQIKLFKIDRETRELIDITTEGGIAVGFERDTYGFCLYKRASDGQLFAFVSRKETDDLHQILLEDDGKGKIKGTLIRQFGKKEMKSFVEGMVADDEYGYLYASDEQFAILKFHADPTGFPDPFISSRSLQDCIKK